MLANCYAVRPSDSHLSTHADALLRGICNYHILHLRHFVDDCMSPHTESAPGIYPFYPRPHRCQFRLILRRIFSLDLKHKVHAIR